MDYIASHLFREIENALPYDEVPGPKGLPIIGNSWRFAPVIGEWVNGYDVNRGDRDTQLIMRGILYAN